MHCSLAEKSWTNVCNPPPPDEERNKLLVDPHHPALSFPPPHPIWRNLSSHSCYIIRSLYIPLISTEMNCSNKSTMLSLDVFVLHLKQTMLPLDVSLQWHLSINPLPDGPGPIGPRVSKANSSKHKSAKNLQKIPTLRFYLKIIL
jgi:hypothetical protein